MTNGPEHSLPEDTQTRQAWMSLLARAPVTEIEEAWERLAPKPDYQFLRRPEIGLVMVRARIGGTGQPFNLGEMTVTRCTVRLTSGHTGHATVAGRVHRHAELAAVFDALLQQDRTAGSGLRETLIDPLAGAEAERRRSRSLKAAATKVDFFTMVRGDN